MVLAEKRSNARITTGNKVVDEVIQWPHLVPEIFGVLAVIAAISAMLYGFLARHRHITVDRSDMARWK